jgi:pseudouridine-5'-phosphate glycosidase
MRRLTRWLRPHNHEIRSVARTAFQHRSGHPQMETRGILGKQVTPFLLQRIFELSDGQSLKANISLVQNNARLAADIAAAFHT